MQSLDTYLKFFEQHWCNFQQQYHLDPTQAQRIYAVLEQAYTEPQRAYHSVQHIVECLDLVNRVQDQLQDACAVQWAIWFHDVVYDVQAIDNESQSAVLMRQQCAEILPLVQCDKVAHWIEATQHHQPSLDQDLNFLLDIDLAILASPTTRFAEYEQQIRQEYAWVADEIYTHKRAEVLRHFYQATPLYQTEYFQQQFEASAKQNLAQALQPKRSR